MNVQRCSTCDEPIANGNRQDVTDKVKAEKEGSADIAWLHWITGMTDFVRFRHVKCSSCGQIDETIELPTDKLLELTRDSIARVEFDFDFESVGSEAKTTVADVTSIYVPKPPGLLVQPSEQLKPIVGELVMPRIDAVKMVWKHIMRYGLMSTDKDDDDKAWIAADLLLRPVFGKRRIRPGELPAIFNRHLVPVPNTSSTLGWAIQNPPPAVPKPR